MKTTLYLMLFFFPINGFASPTGDSNDPVAGNGPTAICKDITVELNPNGYVEIIPSDVDGGSFADGEIVSMTLDNAFFLCNDTGVNEVTLTVEDDLGQTDQCMAFVTVTDIIPPVITCPDYIVTDAGNTGDCSVFIDIPLPDISDVCGIDSLINNFNSMEDASGVYPVGTTTVTYWTSDVNNNWATCTFEVSVLANPVIVCPENPEMVYAGADSCARFVVVPSPDMTGCGSGVQIVNDYNNTDDASGVYPAGITEVLWSIIVEGADTVNCEQQVVVSDNIAPVAICKNLTAELDFSGSLEITPADIDNGSSDNCGIAVMVVDPFLFTTADLGENQVILSVADEAGNVSQCAATVFVTDGGILDPLICIDTSLYLDDNGILIITTEDLEIDPSEYTSVVIEPDTFYCDDAGEHLVSVTVVDFQGISNQCYSNITVLDPNYIITCPGDINFENGVSENCEVFIPVPAPEISGCIQNVEIVNDYTGTSDASAIYPAGNTVVTWTIAIPEQDPINCVQIILVADNQLPVAECSDITVGLGDNDFVQISWEDVVAVSDNCGVADVTLSQSEFNPNNIGDNDVLVTVSDVSGNVSECISVVTVVDSITGLQAITEAGFSFYPNPNSGTFILKTGKMTGNYRLEVIDLTGKAAYAKNIFLIGNGEIEIAAENLIKGIYMLRISNITSSQTHTLRMVVK